MRFLITLLCAAELFAEGRSWRSDTLNPGLKERAMAHVLKLATPGHRVTGTSGESRALAYVKGQMEKAGLKVALEPFQFQSFRLESAVLTIGGQKANIAKLCFDPYSGGAPGGETIFIDPGALDAYSSPSDGKIVVTTERLNFYRLTMFKKPRAVAYLSEADFDRLKPLAGQSGAVSVEGGVVEMQSANLVASLPGQPSEAREVIVSAHVDSWKGAGAMDNASGVAVMLELARQFASLKSPPPYRMRFIAFGAEEVGMVGAKAYLAKHESELRDCLLLFNIDSVGGNGGIVTETRGGIRGVPEKVRSQLPRDLTNKATTDLDGRWILLGPEQALLFTFSSVPAWVAEAAAASARAMGEKMQSSAAMGSDHRVFAQAGVPVTNIAISGGKPHTLEDLPDTVHPESLEKAASLVLGVLERAAAQPLELSAK
jgi:hypothetical protein